MRLGYLSFFASFMNGRWCPRLGRLLDKSPAATHSMWEKCAIHHSPWPTKNCKRHICAL